MDTVIKKSLRYSVFDGIFASIMMGCSEMFISPYAIAMGASARMVGLLAALPSLAGALIQVKSAALSERLGSRKALIVAAVFLQAVMWLPIIAIPYIVSRYQVPWLIALYTVLIAVGIVSFPPWSSLMAEHVAAPDRGKYFGWRNRILGVTNIIAMLASGIVLHLSKKFSATAITGFTVIFSVACAARLCCCYFLAKMHEPKLVIKDEHRFTMLDFLKRMRHSNFGRFAIFAALINFSVFLSGPFFAVYMLRDLKFSYLTYTIITMTSTLTIFAMMRVWGSHADHVGNRRVLRLTSYFLPFIPVLWVFSHNVAYLVAVQIFGGFFWAGFNMSSSNFIYDCVTPEKRTRCVAYSNVINGIAIFAGASTGGFLARCLPPIYGNRLLSLFVLSGLLRLAASPICSMIKEVRQVKHVSSLELFYSIITARQPSSLYESR